MLHYSLTVLSLMKAKGIPCFDVGFGCWEIWLSLIFIVSCVGEITQKRNEMPTKCFLMTYNIDYVCV